MFEVEDFYSAEQYDEDCGHHCEDERWLMGLGPQNTVADFVSELYDSLFRDILGNDTMDRALGSFDKQEMYKTMSVIFLQDGNQKIYKHLTEMN